jgi:hypothetical protein
MSEPTAADFRARYPQSDATDAVIAALTGHAHDLVLSCVLASHDLTDAETVAAIKAATCDQIAAWLETGDSNDLAGYAADTEITVGGFTVKGQPSRVAPRAVRTLKAARLTTPVGA